MKQSEPLGKQEPVAAPTMSGDYLRGLEQAIRVVVSHHIYAYNDFSQEASIWRSAIDAAVGSLVEEVKKVEIKQCIK